MLLLCLALSCADSPAVPVAAPEDVAVAPPEDAPAATPDTPPAPDTAVTPEPDITVAPPPYPTQWELFVAKDAPDAVHATAADVASYLAAFGFETTLDAAAEGALTCAPEVGRLVFAGDGLGKPKLDALDATDQAWRIAETRCARGSLIELIGGGLRGRQYAAYQWLHLLGVRFFHPEEEYVPQTPRWPVDAVTREGEPPFAWRAVTVAVDRPIDVADALFGDDEALLPEALRYVDWLVKNGASAVDRRLVPAALDHALTRGLLPIDEVALFGPTGLLAGDEPDTVATLEAALDTLMAVDPQPLRLTVTVDAGASDTPAPGVIAGHLAVLSDHLLAHFGQTRLSVIARGWHSPAETADVVAATPLNVGVTVEPPLCFDLTRPGPAFGSQDFSFLAELLGAAYPYRRVGLSTWGAWGDGFDLQVPLYLPLVTEARSRDLQAIAPMLAGGLESLRVRSNGHEWGAWQHEYCTLRMGFDVDATLARCREDLTDLLGDAAIETAEVLAALAQRQEQDLLFGGLLPYLAGSDADQAHPQPPSPRSMLMWDLATVTAWRLGTGADLDYTAVQHDQLADRLRAVDADVTPDAASWFAEIFDGVEADALRARFAAQLFGGLAAWRYAELRNKTLEREDALARFAAAAVTHQQLLTVTKRRELDYRYAPIDRAAGVGRYLEPARFAHFYASLTERAAVGMRARTSIQLSDVLLLPDETAVVSIDDPLVSALAALPAVPQTPGAFVLSAPGERDGQPFLFESTVFRVTEEWDSGYTGKAVIPEGLSLVNPFFPNVVVGRLGPEEIVFGAGRDESGAVPLDAWSRMTCEQTEGMVLDCAADLAALPILNRDSGLFIESLLVLDAVVQLPEDSNLLTVAGIVPVSAVIEAGMAAVGFPEKDTISVIATLLGYTAETLPDAAFVSATFEMTQK